MYSLVFFRRRTACEVRISGWSSAVCSSDLVGANVRPEKGDVVDVVVVAGEHIARDDIILRDVGVADHQEAARVVAFCTDLARDQRARLEAFGGFQRAEIGFRRPEESRVGQACVSTFMSGWAP